MELDRLEMKVIDECERHLRRKKVEVKGLSHEQVLTESLNLLKEEAEKAYARNGVTEKIHTKILKVKAVLNIVRKKKFVGGD